MDFQSEYEPDEGRTDEVLTGHTHNPTNYANEHDSGPRNTDGNFPLSSSEQHPSHSSSYYAQAQNPTNDWPLHDQGWNNQYAVTTSTSSSYDVSHYSSTGISVGTTYDANCYENTYPDYTAQGGYYATTGDSRAFVGTNTTYDAVNDIPGEASGRNEIYDVYTPENTSLLGRDSRY